MSQMLKPRYPRTGVIALHSGQFIECMRAKTEHAKAYKVISPTEYIIDGMTYVFIDSVVSLSINQFQHYEYYGAFNKRNDLDKINQVIKTRSMEAL